MKEATSAIERRSEELKQSSDGECQETEDALLSSTRLKKRSAVVASAEVVRMDGASAEEPDLPLRIRACPPHLVTAKGYFR
jgi:hypothetical protein